MQKHQIQQTLITLSIWALILSVESKSAFFAYGTQATVLEGVQFAAITILGAILAALGFTLIGQIKADERPHVRRNVFVIRALAITFLMFPVFFFGSSVKLHNQQQAWDAFAASPAYAVAEAKANQANLTISDRTIADYEIDEAAESLVRPTNASLTPLDGEFWFALILLGVLNLAAEKFRVPAPITQEERLTLMYKARGAKAAATRRRKKQAKEVRKGFRLLPGKKA